MSTLQERIAEVMQARQWDHADLVRISGQSSSVVSQWRGKSSKIIKSIGSMKAAQNIEAASGYCALWVAKGEGPKLLARDLPASAYGGSKVPASWHDRLAALEADQLAAVIGAVEAMLIAYEAGRAAAHRKPSARLMGRVYTLAASPPSAHPATERDALQPGCSRWRSCVTTIRACNRRCGAVP